MVRWKGWCLDKCLRGHLPGIVPAYDKWVRRVGRRPGGRLPGSAPTHDKWVRRVGGRPGGYLPGSAPTHDKWVRRVGRRPGGRLPGSAPTHDKWVRRVGGRPGGYLPGGGRGCNTRRSTGGRGSWRARRLDSMPAGQHAKNPAEPDRRVLGRDEYMVDRMNTWLTGWMSRLMTGCAACALSHWQPCPYRPTSEQPALSCTRSIARTTLQMSSPPTRPFLQRNAVDLA
eukprot:363488-Chlamydomonas_euryale.AAC.2